MEKVSIIIPIYNAEKYIEKCLTSVINQTYQNIEIICIDNNSTDNSIDILKKYQKLDSRIILEKEKNAGVSYARNHGINICSGKYISFIDADDYIERDYTESLVKNIQEQCDISICNFNIIQDGNIKYRDNINNKNYLTKEEIIERIFLRNEFCAFCWNKLYKTDIIKKNKISFNEKQEICEDLLFNLSYLKASNKGGIYDESKKYNYFQHSDSSYNNLSMKKWRNIRELENSIEKMEIVTTAKQKENWYFYFLCILLDYKERCYYARDKKEISVVSKKINSIKKYTFINKSINFTDKMKIFLKIYMMKIMILMKKYRRKNND